MFTGNCVNKIVMEINSRRLFEILAALRDEGYGSSDFSFLYTPPSYENYFHPIVEFTFYTESLASWFAIKYN